MKIKSKDGSVIDLGEVRGDAQLILTAPQPYMYSLREFSQARYVTALLDALEAALSVSPRDCEAQTIEMSDYKEGWNECRDEQRRRAGVIEESA